MKVLLLVDVQNDFCPGGALAVPEGDRIVPIINKLVASKEFDLVIATRDFHPPGHVSFAETHKAQLFSQIDINGGKQTMWPNHCVQGSAGAELHPQLDRKAIHHVIHKGTNKEIDSYSAFFDNARASETPLRALLLTEAKRRGVEPGQITLSVCGLALDYCVAWSALDAQSLGFKTEVIVDATRAVNLCSGDDLKTLRQLAERGVSSAVSDEYLKPMQREVSRATTASARERGVEVGR
jgi:nicotinamidase/pyrazinamidase